MALITIGRYTLQAQLGAGGMATVYRGHDPRLAREVAIKLLLGDIQGDPALRERFEREAHTIARLEHPAIVPVYDFGEDQGQLYLVMRLMTGGSLQDRLKRGPLAPEVVAHIVDRLADALDTAHAQGIIHRDLKPGNILFDEYDNPMISDFGIAKLALQAGAATLTQTGALVGTPAYMSPEQVRGDADIDRRSDLYAFGIIAYEMLTGRLPFKADTPYGLLMQHIVGPLPRVVDANPALPAECQPVVERALAKAREDRFATAGQFAAALREALGLRQTPRPISSAAWQATLLPTSTGTPPQPEAAADALARIREATPVPRPPRRRWAVPAVIAAGALALLFVAAALVGGGLLVSRWLLRTPAPPTAQAATPTVAVVTRAPTAVAATRQPDPTATPAPTPTATVPPLVADPISLAPIVNGSLDNDFAAPPIGLVELGGVSFDLDGRAFRSQAGPAPNNAFPTQASLSVALPGVEHVYVLVTAGDGFTRWAGKRVGQIVLTFEGAEPVVVDLVLGENLREWHAADNVVSTAPGITEVWSGPIAGFPNLQGHLDLLTIDVPPDRAAATLTRIDIVDLSTETVASRDPALTVSGLTIAHR